MSHPFAELIDPRTGEQRAEFSKLELAVPTVQLNPHHMVHGVLEEVW